jgi:hypothetical protein
VRAYTLDDYWELLVLKYQQRHELVPRRWRWWYRAAIAVLKRGGR